MLDMRASSSPGLLDLGVSVCFIARVGDERNTPKNLPSSLA
jgi:hypothetical protein